MADQGGDLLLPATTYESPSRLARRNKLNTIIEDKFAENEEEYETAQQSQRIFREEIKRLEAQSRAQSASPVPSLTSSISSYYRQKRDSSDFDDLYDVSDEDSDFSPSIMTSQRSDGSLSPGTSQSGKAPKHKYPSLVIPSPRFWPGVKAAQDLPPRPPKIPLSPAVLQLLGTDLPGPSKTPSLISSMNSDPNAGGSAPSTPDTQSLNGDAWSRVTDHVKSTKHLRPVIRIRTDHETLSPRGSSYSPGDGISVRDFASASPLSRSESPTLGSEDEEAGVELPLDALQTLQHLTLVNPSLSIPEESPWEEMQERPDLPTRPSSGEITPASQVSEYSISKMSIPSPSGFFSSLMDQARRTWCVPSSVPASALPPSSTTAENFYTLPWMKDIGVPIERFVAALESHDGSSGPSTARPFPTPSSMITPRARSLYGSPRFTVDEVMDLQDDEYEKALQDRAEKNQDRTSDWLAAQ